MVILTELLLKLAVELKDKDEIISEELLKYLVLEGLLELELDHDEDDSVEGDDVFGEELDVDWDEVNLEDEVLEAGAIFKAELLEPGGKTDELELGDEDELLEVPAELEEENIARKALDLEVETLELAWLVELTELLLELPPEFEVVSIESELVFEKKVLGLVEDGNDEERALELPAKLNEEEVETVGEELLEDFVPEGFAEDKVLETPAELKEEEEEKIGEGLLESCALKELDEAKLLGYPE